MITLNAVEKFYLFCLECYKQTGNLSGKEIYQLFKEKEVYTFLENNFEVLHTQSKNYIIDEIKNYIKNS